MAGEMAEATTERDLPAQEVAMTATATATVAAVGMMARVVVAAAAWAVLQRRHRLWIQ